MNASQSKAAEPYFEALVWEDEHPSGHVGHVCAICGRDVTDGPCPDHAPSVVPGLTKVVCEANPPHQWWTIAGDYYDPPCFQCLYFESLPKPEQCRHWPWRRWKVTHRAMLWLHPWLVKGHGINNGYGCHWCVHRIWWRFVPQRKASL